MSFVVNIYMSLGKCVGMRLKIFFIQSMVIYLQTKNHNYLDITILVTIGLLPTLQYDLYKFVPGMFLCLNPLGVQ